MDESSALKVVAMRAVETTDTARTLWTDEDRAWASRAAAEVVGAEGAPEAFLARRATLGIEKLGVLQPALPRIVRALQWRSWVGIVVVVGAFALGIVLDQVDSTQRINILAPPVLGLLFWNLAVYVAIVAGYVARYGEEGNWDCFAAHLRESPAAFRGHAALARYEKASSPSSTTGHVDPLPCTEFAPRASCTLPRRRSPPA